jgi:hypothetical protein
MRNQACRFRSRFDLIKAKLDEHRIAWRVHRDAFTGSHLVVAYLSAENHAEHPSIPSVLLAPTVASVDAFLQVGSAQRHGRRC